MRAEWRAILPSLALAVLAACGGGGGSNPAVPEGEGTVVIESESLVAVRDACHVQGTLLNTAVGTRFDVVLRWQAFDAAEKILGTTRANIGNVAPGERRSYDATGFASNSQGLVPCSRIARFERIETQIIPR